MKRINLLVYLICFLILVAGCEEVEITKPGNGNSVSTPENLTITGFDSSTVSIAWDYTQDEAEYFEIFVKKYEVYGNILIGAVPGNVHQFTFEYTDADVDVVDIQVRAYKNKIFSEFARTLKVIKFDEVTFIGSNQTSDDSLSIEWTYESLTLGFRIYREFEDGTKQLETTLDADVFNYIVPFPDKNEIYKYYVVPFDYIDEGKKNKAVIFEYKYKMFFNTYEEELAPDNKMYTAKFLSNSQFLIAANGEVYTYDQNTKSKNVFDIAAAGLTNVDNIILSNDKNYFATTGTPDDVVAVYSASLTAAPRKTFTIPGKNITCVEISSTGNIIYAGDTEGNYYGFDVQTGGMLYTKNHTSGIVDMALTSNENILYLISGNGDFLSVSAENGAVLMNNNINIGELIDLELSNSDNKVAIRSNTATSVYSTSPFSEIMNANIKGIPNAMAFNEIEYLYVNIDNNYLNIFNTNKPNIYVQTGTYYEVKSIDTRDKNVLMCDSEGFISLWETYFGWAVTFVN